MNIPLEVLLDDFKQLLNNVNEDQVNLLGSLRDMINERINELKGSEEDDREENTEEQAEA